ncbi:hypothetical protein ACFXJ8_00845 [Nonomuraea sp. NPDC059194]|uniref:hypothetical protein n=1 Tax=Nonomuraea sp. NPDC059194 TaxID=3346764 RepID=UPI0036BBD155
MVGQDSQGFGYVPDSLRKAMRACADQVDDVATMRHAFAPAALTRRDFGLAPGAEEVANAYCGDPGRYESVVTYLNDLQQALNYIAVALDTSETVYAKAEPR